MFKPMTTLREWLTRIWATLRPRRSDADLAEELRLHLDLTAEHEARLGTHADDAGRAVRLQLGSVTQTMDALRDQRGMPWLEDIWRDVRYAVRLMIRQPRFSLLILLTMALAVGVSTALFSVADATLLRPLPYRHAEQLMDAGVGFMVPELKHLFYRVAVSDLRRWRRSDAVAAAAGYRPVPWGSILDGRVPKKMTSREVTEGYLGLYGAAPALGRDFTLADTQAASPPVVMLSHAVWRAEFGADPGVIGRLIRYDDVNAEIVGVTPAGFQPDIKLWRAIRVDDTQVDSRVFNVTAVVRLKSDLTVEDAARRLSAITPVGDGRSAAGGMSAALGGQVRLTSLLDGAIERYETVVRILAGAVGLIVLIACVNVAGLLLARGAVREAELAIRVSIGAGRLRLIRQLLIESVTLSLAGGALGVLVARLSLDALMAILPIALQPGAEAAVNLRVLTAAGVLAIVTGMAFGLAPAVRLSRASIAGDVARGTRRHGASLSRRSGQSLIAAEVGLAVMLVAGAGLMIRSFTRLLSVDLGFDPRAVVAFNTAPVDTAPAAQAQYYSTLLEAIRALPGVADAGAVDHFALGQTSVSMGLSANGKNTAMGIRQVLPGYFEAMGFQLRAGRFPAVADGVAAESVTVINESAARALFPEGAVGQVLTFSNRPLTVIGVVADFHHAGPLYKRSPEVFVPFQPAPPGARRALGLTVVVRARPGATRLVEPLRRTAESLGPRALVEDARPGTDWFSDRVATPRHQTALIGLLGVFGLTLTLIGVFSTTAYAVARRTREIGVRMALGAQPADVVGRMVREAGWPMLFGLSGGLAGAYYATQVVQSFLFETVPHDPVTFVAVALFMAVTALVAAWIPARRAAHVDPVAALRAE